MPKKGYTTNLLDSEVINLFRRGRYRVDPDTGEVFGRDGTKPLYVFTNKRFRQAAEWRGQKWVRLYAHPKMRALPVSHAVWMFCTMRAIPPGFEIHHRNKDRTDDRWLNLFALYEDDHRK